MYVKKDVKMLADMTRKLNLWVEFSAERVLLCMCILWVMVIVSDMLKTEAHDAQEAACRLVKKERSRYYTVFAFAVEGLD